MTRVWIPGEDEVLQALFKLGPSSAREIARELRGEDATPSEVRRVSCRLSTLRMTKKITHCWRNVNYVSDNGSSCHSTYKVYRIAEGSQ